MRQVFLMLVVALFSTSVFAEVKIGYIDMQQAIQTTSTGKKAKASLEKDFNKKKAQLSKKEKDLKKMTEDFEKKSLVLSEDVRNKKQAELQKEMLKYQREVSKSQLEIQKKERQLIAPIAKKLTSIIDDIAKKEGYTMILHKSDQNVIWAKADADITKKVVDLYEKKK